MAEDGDDHRRIGGAGAGVGGIVKGKKGALIGAAIGGGAASIYEATRRR